MRRTTDRGQLLLVGAVVVATVIVSMVVLLNGVQFTEASGRGTVDETADAEQTQMSVQRDLQTLLWHVDEPGPYASDNATFQAAVSVYSSTVANTSAAGEPVSVTVAHDWDATQNGSVAAGSIGATGGGDVAVADDVDAVVVAEINATERTGADPFALNVTADGSGAAMRVGVDQNTVELRRADGTTTQLCDAPVGSSERVRVTLRGTVGDVTTTDPAVDCRSFDATPTFAPPYDVALNSTGNADGAYNVTVVGGTTQSAPETRSDVIVNPAYELAYQRPRLSYTTSFRTYNTTRP